MTTYLVRAGLALVTLGLVAVVEALAQGVAPATADPIVRLGPEIWFVIAGALVTVGINLEQLRRVRSDMRDVKTATNAREDKVERRHEENVRNFAKLDHRLDRVEDTLDFLKTRRRADRPIAENEG